MQLLLWVHLSGGPTIAAKELGVSRWLLWHWIAGTREPSFLQRAEIYRATQGAVGPEDIKRLASRRFTGRCPACGRAMNLTAYDDMRRDAHGGFRRGGGPKKLGSGRKKDSSLQAL